MLAIRALSTVFWSAARLLLISFFCTEFISVLSFHVRVGSERTWGFSPCLKKASSPAFSAVRSRAKYFSEAISSTFLLSRPLRSILYEVAITYRELTRRRGTPLILNGPVTRRTPCSRFLRRTTRLPRKRPASRIRTVPGWRVERGAQARTDLRTYLKPVSQGVRGRSM